MRKTTVDITRDSSRTAPHGAPRVPGLVVLMDNGLPRSEAITLPKQGLVLGRNQPPSFFAADETVSRSHLRVRRVAGCWSLEDPGSRNGSYLNGTRIEGLQVLEGNPLVRLGRSLCWLVEDVTPFAGGVRCDGDTSPVLGGAMQEAFRQIEAASQASDTLLITGPSGSGKELAARAFHRAFFANTNAPFIAVNCAAIPEGLAERLLFGATKGAYSGATHDAQGYLQAAHGGTLFLDEFGELDLRVQAKLLRVIETREVLALGATRTQAVNVRICAATLHDVLAQVEEGRFRRDLYYRLGRPEVALPALRARLDELPFLIRRILSGVNPELSFGNDLVEACALRPWPGNVRELIGEVRRAGFLSLQRGQQLVRAEHLADHAGRDLFGSPQPSSPSEGLERDKSQWPSDTQIRQVLRDYGGNVSGAAKALGLHRNQLRRWLARAESTSTGED